MKRVLITGENSYIGNSFANWVKNDTGFSVDFISCRTNNWREESFSKYDVILHVAGIAHIKENKKNSNLYFQINRDLTEQLAIKAKHEGISQFVFISSLSVYGIDEGVINSKSLLNPSRSYGVSKLQAEKKIRNLETERFKICIVRPPMVYGKGCKGNYNKLAKLVKKSLVFPYISNQRSMIYIDNLTEFLKLCIENKSNGTFIPQNLEYVSTVDMVTEIARVNKKHIKFIKIYHPIIHFLIKRVSVVRKVFGDLIVEKENSDYCVVNFKQSIKLTENK